MAKTISEMAEEYAKAVAISPYSKEDYISGANAVLDEIEKCLNEHHFNSAFFLEDTIRESIKELKGK